MCLKCPLCFLLIPASFSSLSCDARVSSVRFCVRLVHAFHLPAPSLARPLARKNKRTPARPHPRARTPSRARSLPQVNLGLRGGGLLVKGTPLSWEDSLQVFLRVRAYVRVFVCIMRTRKHTHVLIHSNPEEFARLRRCVCACVHVCLSVCQSESAPVSLFIPLFFARCAARYHSHKHVHTRKHRQILSQCL